MASEETAPAEDTQLTFKVKTSSDGNHSITMSESATVLDLKTKLSGDDYEKISVDRMRLIYSGRVMKDPEPLKTYKIKSGNTVHMVKNAQSNVAPQAASAPAQPAVPTNMAAGTANNPLAGLTGARYAGHMGLPGADMFGADGGMGAPPSEDQIASMLDDPNIQQTMNEALQNPAMIDMMMQQLPGLRDDPNARAMLQSPEFRRMMTNPEALRQAAAMRRMMQGQGGGGGVGGFPAPGVTDSTPTSDRAAGSPGAPGQTPFNPFTAGALGTGPQGGNPFAALFGPPTTGQTPSQTPPPPASAGQGTPSANDAAANPFASLFGNPSAAAGGPPNPFGQMPPITPEMMAQAQQMMNNGGFGNMFGGGGGSSGGGGPNGGGGVNPFAAFGQGATSPPPIHDSRPPEELYAEQLRQLNDMGFYEFDRNVAALRRSGGSVQGAIEQLLNQ